MVAEIDTGGAKHVDADHRKRDTGPAEEPGAECQQRQQMVASDRERVAPIDPPAICRDWKRKRLRRENHAARVNPASLLHQVSNSNYEPALYTSLAAPTG